MTKIIKVAFYKDHTDIYDKLISWWTSSPYTHVEIIIDDIWYSSSPRDGGVRSKTIIDNEDHWDYISFMINVPNENCIMEVISNELGKKYDWLGIFLTQFIPIGVQNPNKWFCSEFVAMLLKHYGISLAHNNQWYSPSDLYSELKYINQKYK